ncbi:MAG: gliding motility-associated C-terminal domain-containing protein [Chitinophagales bacterium]
MQRIKHQGEFNIVFDHFFGLYKGFVLSLVTLGGLFIAAIPSYAQNNPCSVSLIANPTVVVCGSPVQLSASASGGSFALYNNFNNGNAGAGWQTTSSAQFNNPCVGQTGSADGTTHLWMGSASAVPRSLTSVPLDLSSGGSISFDMVYSIQGANAPCEGPDLPSEGVYLQYSLDGGSTWVTIDYWDPLGGNDPTLTSWNNYTIPIPSAANQANVLIRWIQTADSNAGYDHWGLDNIEIQVTQPGNFSWNISPSTDSSITYTPVTSGPVTVTYDNGSVPCQATVNITVLPSNDTIDDVFCEGSSYLLPNGVSVNLAGSYDVLLPGLNGCDTNRTFQLAVTSSAPDTAYVNICDNTLPYLLPDGSSVSVGGSYFTAGIDTNGCVDTTTTILAIYSADSIVDSALVCQQDGYILPGGAFVDSTGVYVDILSNIAGCDSTIVTHLTVLPEIDESYDIAICAGDSITIHGQVYLSSGSYQDTLFNQLGCDSIRWSLELLVYSQTDSAVLVNVCEADLPFDWRGRLLANEGFYSDTVRYTTTSCDSIRFNLELVIDSVSYDSSYQVVCQENLPLLWRGQSISRNGWFYDTVFAQSGCDSISYATFVTIDSVEFDSSHFIGCEDDLPHQWRGLTTNVSTILRDTVVNGNGCDSIHFVQSVTILPSVDSSLVVTVCQDNLPFVWRGSSYTATGLYRDTVRYSNQLCDSIRFLLNLVIDSFTEVNEMMSVCQDALPVLWKGQVLTSEGIYFDTTYSPAGCDLVRSRLDFRIDSIEYDTAFALICAVDTPYAWRNQQLTSSGRYRDTLRNAIGCDSILYVFDLTIQFSFQEVSNIELCEDDLPFFWRGYTLTQPGIFYDTIRYVNSGCDSMHYEMTFDVDYRSAENYSFTQCDGDSVTLHGLVYSSSGFYEDTLRNQRGCDSVTWSVDLTINTPYDLIPSIEDSVFCLRATEKMMGVDYPWALQYEWSGPDNLNGSIVDIVIPGTYVIDILQDNTCQVKDTVTIEFEDCVGECRVVAPTAFSPNGDGINDIFLVKEDCPFGYDDFMLEIYDRWGNLMFQSFDPSLGWDGYFQGNLAPLGVYTWYTSFKKSRDENSTNHMVHGNITLIK